MADALEKILECPICLEQIENPKMLPCQHSFCMEKCLRKLLKSETIDYQRKVTCPMCMKVFPVPKEGFPTHYVLQNLLENQDEIKMPAVASLFSTMNLKSDSISDRFGYQKTRNPGEKPVFFGTRPEPKKWYPTSTRIREMVPEPNPTFATRTHH